jgi:UDP-N-acetylmuramoylalanine--D-glutamate ligase
MLCNSLEHAVKKAFLEASSLTNILLSPGFSSFDLFKNYQERGNLFQKFVLEIKKLHSFQNNHIIA